MDHPGTSEVYVCKTTDRAAGVKALSERYSLDSLRGMKVAIKANYNSADPFPASTHLDTLSAIVDMLNANEVAGITLAERSGMGETSEVIHNRGVDALAAAQDFDYVLLDDLGEMCDWDRQGTAEGFHWANGYLFPKVFSEADAIVNTCCLKTHRFGGHITMSLKNSVGMVAAIDPESGYNYMRELHGSRYQRQMIAEINTAYAPAFVIMDAIKGFSHGGPEQGTLIGPGLMLASSDRVALDACGVAILRMYDTTPEISHGSIFRLDQIARAGELGLGAMEPGQVKVVPVGDEARDICMHIDQQLHGKMMAPL